MTHRRTGDQDPSRPRTRILLICAAISGAVRAVTTWLLNQVMTDR
ncbi:hypothetical protein ACFXGI_34635 [Streptomyces sp. NPDC059355]